MPLPMLNHVAQSCGPKLNQLAREMGLGTEGTVSLTQKASIKPDATPDGFDVIAQATTLGNLITGGGKGRTGLENPPTE